MSYEIYDRKTGEVLASPKRIGAAQHTLIGYLVTRPAAIIRMHLPSGKTLTMSVISGIGEGGR